MEPKERKLNVLKDKQYQQIVFLELWGLSQQFVLWSLINEMDLEVKQKTVVTLARSLPVCVFTQVLPPPLHTCGITPSV